MEETQEAEEEEPFVAEETCVNDGDAEDTTPPIIDAMERWLCSDEFEAALKQEYADACKGMGHHDRNIAEEIFMDTVIALFHHLPADIQMIIPEPDIPFIDGCVEPVLGNNLRKSGIENMEKFETGVQAVYMMLAHCATLLTAQLCSTEPRQLDKLNIALQAAGL